MNDKPNPRVMWGIVLIYVCIVLAAVALAGGGIWTR